MAKKDVIDGHPLVETTPRPVASTAGFIIGMITGIVLAFVMGIGLITIILALIAYFKNALLGGLALTVIGILWLVVPWALFGDEQMFTVAFVIIFLPAGLMNMLSGILFTAASRKSPIHGSSRKGSFRHK